jgi:hypothetical protein
MAGSRATWHGCCNVEDVSVYGAAIDVIELQMSWNENLQKWERWTMDHDAYLAGVAELYTAEVLGERLASRWLELSSTQDQKYKLGLFLQLESEAKVRLRPLLARLGLDLVEDERQRSAGAEVAEKFASMPWQGAMANLADLARPYLERFEALLAAAPPQDAPIVSFMVAHEGAVIRAAKHEAVSEGSWERELLPMLAYPLSRTTLHSTRPAGTNLTESGKGA